MASSTPFPSTASDSPNRYPTNTRTPHSQLHHPLLRDTRSSDPTRPSPSSSSPLRVNVNAPNTASPRKPPSLIDSPPRSAARSRPTSPIRGILQWGLHRQERERETPFVPVDPFSRRFRRFSLYNSPDVEQGHRPFVDPVACEESLFFCCFPCPNPRDRIRKHAQRAKDFITDTLPRQVYLHLMLRLPSLYFSRIARLFEEAEVSQPDIDRLLRACEASNRTWDRRARMSPIPQTPNVYHHDHGLPFSDDWTTANVGPALVRFKSSWESFIDSLLREWKTLNIVSALLLSAILSMFQNQEMSYDPLVRTTALLSLTCALMSLLYGCVYIIRFATMKSMYKATRWAQETQRTTTFILWNVWVMLALPGIWLAWSMIFFIVSILAFVWHSGSTTDPATPSPLSPNAAIGPRVLISAFFFLGLVYFCAIVKTLQGYGRVSGTTRDTEMARETRDAIREGRDGEREMERRSERGRGRERRPGRGRANDREKDWKRTPREDDGPESEPEPISRTYNHGGGNDDRSSSALDVLPGLGLRGLESPRASDEQGREQERTRDVARDVVYEEGSLESGEGREHRDGTASV
ncbi:hypothetical protein F5J12DRAFT_852910 [Pisolithus orientalis]|uniref:uncharacterized protein n=1 Tax=Pisolithus orientalis TaxID=936130 RepID=UPI0022252773|nr:uncharacterized protein F5J12DRAFT_852910 [Pisolithus orientalis]KAI5996536.1 hypothetical protein F5J12DRAFT_852910 [Pisolithus orientalis]